MRYFICYLSFLFLLGSCKLNQLGSSQSSSGDYVVLIHGGAGSYSEDYVTAEKRAEYEKTFTEILLKADSMLRDGARSVDVVQACIVMMENDPLFNAGKGAVFTADGIHTLDASIMEGKTCRAGAVAGIKHTKNPIKAARLVMDSSVHVLLSGAGADEFAERHGLKQVKNSYFDTYQRKQNWEKRKNLEKHGTVGCVVLDSYGNLAAGTSTGGMSMKRYGRIGDSPIIGAGTYADNETCAISCTGHGEYFIRYAVAYDLHARMKYKNISLGEAAAHLRVFMNEKKINGGFIAVDRKGNIAKVFNTHGMLTGELTKNGIRIKLYENEIIQK